MSWVTLYFRSALFPNVFAKHSEWENYVLWLTDERRRRSEMWGKSLWVWRQIHRVAPCTSHQEAARQEEIFALQRANRGEYWASLQSWGQIWGDRWSVIGSASHRQNWELFSTWGSINTQKNDSPRSMLRDSGCYLTASNTCNRHFAFSLCMCLGPQAATGRPWHLQRCWVTMTSRLRSRLVTVSQTHTRTHTPTTSVKRMQLLTDFKV